MKGIIQQVLDNGAEVYYGDIQPGWEQIFTDLQRPYIPDDPTYRDGFFYYSGSQYNKRYCKDFERHMRLSMGLRLPMDIFIIKYDRSRRRKRK